MKPFLPVFAVLLVALMVACGQPAPTPTPPPPARPAATQPPAAVASPTSPPAAPATVASPTRAPQAAATLAPGASQERKSAIEQLVPEVQAAFEGKDRDDLITLLRNAEQRVNQEERFEAYQGAWQLMRLLYSQQGQKDGQRAVMGKLEEIIKAFPQYKPEQFSIDKK